MDIDEKNDLTRRKIPLTALILIAAYKTKVEPTVIRKKLEMHLEVSSTRISQIENYDKKSKRSCKRKQLLQINAFFTELLGESVDITATVSAVGEGLFLELTV